MSEGRRSRDQSRQGKSRISSNYDNVSLGEVSTDIAIADGRESPTAEQIIQETCNVPLRNDTVCDESYLPATPCPHSANGGCLLWFGIRVAQTTRSKDYCSRCFMMNDIMATKNAALFMVSVMDDKVDCRLHPIEPVQSRRPSAYGYRKR